MNTNNKTSTLDNILVAGVIRNGGKFIVRDIKRLDKSLAGFKNVKYIIIESDSDDNTLEELEKLKMIKSDFCFISLGKLKKEIPNKTERIAFCRNKYLEELENNEAYKEINYLLVTDLDGTNELLTAESILSCLKISDWDVCTANQLGIYYDIWAFRHPLISPNDCWKVFGFMKNELGLNIRAIKKKALKSRLFWFRRSISPLEVDSAFGGLAIYKRHVINNVRYIGVDENGSQICEHVALNKKIREKGGKIYINPKMINCFTPAQYEKSKLKRLALTTIRNGYYYLIDKLQN